MPYPSARFLPLANFSRRLMRGPRDLRELASEINELAPAEVETVAPAICLPDAETQLRAVPSWSTLETELAVLDTVAHHAPVRRYQFRDVLVHPAGFDVPGGGRFRVRRSQGIAAGLGPVAQIAKASYCLSRASNTFFGHWLQDACPTALLAGPDEALFLAPHPEWGHAHAYLRAFGLSPVTAPVAHVETLHLYEDYAQGTSKRQRYDILRQRLRAAFPSQDDGPRRVYLRRGTGGVRRAIDNESALMARLADAGITTVDVMGASLADLAHGLRSARLVISLEGSHVNHLHFLLNARARLLVLMPAGQASLVHLGLSRALGFRFGFCVLAPGRSGHVADIGAVMATLDLLEQQPSDDP